MHLRLIRHATLVLTVGDRRLLVDPMLDPPGARPPAATAPRPRPNPLVALPEPAAVVVHRVGAVLVTRLDEDHLDATALALLDPALPVLCRPEDAAGLRERGRMDVRPVEDRLRWEGIEVARPAGGAPGFLLTAPGEPPLYLAGAAGPGPELRAALERHAPAAVVVGAGGGRAADGEPAGMRAGDVVALARLAPRARVVAVRLDAIDRCEETRADLHQRVHEAGLEDRVTVPEDGAEVPL